MTDDRLRQIVERIERLLEERAGINDDIRDVYAEAKAVGYSPATIRQLIARRAMKPDDRAEADALLEAYENALGGDGEALQRVCSSSEAVAARAQEASRELAIAILAEQVEGIGDPDQAAKLAEHVAVILDIRAEVALLRAQEKARKALAASEGFDAPALTRVVRWIEQVARHGAEAMRAGEALFHLYRGTVEGRGGPSLPAPVAFDPAKEKAGRKGAAASKNAARNAAWLASGLGE